MTFLPRFSYLDVCKLVLLYPSVLTSLPESTPLRTLDEERAVEATGATRKRLSARRARVCVSYNGESGLRSHHTLDPCSEPHHPRLDCASVEPVTEYDRIPETAQASIATQQCCTQRLRDGGG
jgi:hypothetical protein